MNNLQGSDLYILTTQLLLGYQLNPTLFYQLLGMCQLNRELMRSWMLLRSEDKTQVANPSSASMYLTPFDLPDDFLNFYGVKRNIVLAAADGITFRWYDQIPLERKHESKDDDSKFYVDYKNSQFYLCGILDKRYTIHQFYIAQSPTITAATYWVFPAQFQPILAYDVAAMYKKGFKYDIINATQAKMIEDMAAVIFKQMTEWDGALQESALEGADYPLDNVRGGFRVNVVGDNWDL